MMTSAQVVETSVNVTNNSPSRDYSDPDDQTTQTTETPGFKPFTVIPEIDKYLKQQCFASLYPLARKTVCLKFQCKSCKVVAIRKNIQNKSSS